MTAKRGYTAKVALGVLEVLCNVPRATCDKIAQDIGCSADSVRMRIKLDLIPRNLVEAAGVVEIPGTRRSPMTYRIGRRLRTQP